VAPHHGWVPAVRAGAPMTTTSPPSPDGVRLLGHASRTSLVGQSSPGVFSTGARHLPGARAAAAELRLATLEGGGAAAGALINAMARKRKPPIRETPPPEKNKALMAALQPYRGLGLKGARSKGGGGPHTSGSASDWLSRGRSEPPVEGGREL
jgi:hypothetical protein